MKRRFGRQQTVDLFSLNYFLDEIIDKLTIEEKANAPMKTDESWCSPTLFVMIKREEKELVIAAAAVFLLK